MAFLSSQGDTVTTFVASEPQVEPLSGPPRLNELMRRFPDSVYAQGPDTHLYKFLETLCGDAGAGLLQKQTFIARLQGEAEILSYKDLDDFYTHHFRFGRISPEIYSFDTDIVALTPDEWDDVDLKDSRYKHRAQTFFNATRVGCTPLGMAMAAEGGSGVETEVREHYRYIYDQYSDDQLGLEPYGRSTSVNEFVVMPRLANASGELSSDYAFELDHIQTVTFTPPTPSGSRPITNMARLTVTETYVERETLDDDVVRGWYFLKPSIHRNMLDMLDRLRPVGTFMTQLAQEYRHTEISPSPVVDSSTERILPTRFVNGRSDVNWPTPSDADAYFIEGGIEKQAPSYADSGIEKPNVFHTIANVIAYTDEALNDPTYGTSDFYGAPLELYRSEHYGTMNPAITSIFTPLGGIPSDAHFPPSEALAPNTLLIAHTAWRGE